MFIMTAKGWKRIVCKTAIPPPLGTSPTLHERWLAMARGEAVDKP
jgi:hypothetical protein